MDLLGKILGSYRIDHLLGEGGMGTVYQAYDLSLQREVAIKLIHMHLARRADFRERFIQEARLMAHLDHPGIVRVYHMGVEKDLLYLPMEFIQGGNLRQLLDELLRQRKWIPLSEAVLLLQQLCQTVEYAHQKGVLHRDIKPANLMLKPEPTGGLPFRVVLTDLGLAKLLDGLGMTQEGTSMGTPAYMSPEQASGKPTDRRSDVYSLGILLYELAVGRLPFPIRSLTEATRYHTQVPPPAPRSIRPDLSEEFEHIILKALEKDPNNRYPSAKELESALAALTIHGISQVASVSTEMGESDQGQETSLIAEYEKSIIADPRLGEASLATVFDMGAQISQRGVSIFADLSIPPGAQPLIQIINKDKSSTMLPLPSGTLTIGRDKDNPIVLQDEKASRKHAQISWDGVECHVIDLDSSNGTFLENVRLLPGVPETWHPNQILRIGDSWLRLIGPGVQRRAESNLSSTTAFYTSAGAGLVAVAVDPQHLQVQASGTVTTRIALLNQSPEVDHFSLSLTGIPVDWISSLPPVAHLMPGEQQETACTLQVPRAPESQAGQHELTLTVTSQRDPSQSVDVRLLLTVEAYSQFEGNIQPQRLRTGQSGSLTISNQGNGLEKFTIQFQDAANELTFQPPHLEVEVPAGQSAEKNFQAQLRETRWIGGRKLHPFTASVRLPKAEPQTIHAEMLSRGLIPPWLPPVALFVCLALLGGAGLLYRQGQLASDADLDGLILTEEMKYECLPNDKDSDDDVLTDSQEIEWGTDCRVWDSDGDSLSDGEEVEMGISPTNRDTDGDGLADNVDPYPLELPIPTRAPTITSTPKPREEEGGGQPPAPAGASAATLTKTPERPPPAVAPTTITPTWTPRPSRGTCRDGYVFRLIISRDQVCVSPARKAQADADNQAAESRRIRSVLINAYGENACAYGYVWREAFPGDQVCVTPASRDQAALDNEQGPSRIDQAAPPYCRFGFVWREAGDDDRVCVEGWVRDQTQIENSEAESYRAINVYGEYDCVSGYVWREAFQGDLVCVTAEERQQVANDNSDAVNHTWP